MAKPNDPAGAKPAPTIPAAAPSEVEVLNAKLAEANAKLAENEARLKQLSASAATGIPFEGEYLEQYHARIRAGLTPEQSRAVTADQKAHDEKLAAAATAAK
jgi:hypothetical protein